jgi:alpha-ketoglutarate-dependent taurine dioxygenase
MTREHPATIIRDGPFRVRRLMSAFAAEIIAPPFRDWPSDCDLLALLQEHLVLVFRGQDDLTLNEQLSLTGLFGKVAESWDVYHRHPDNDRVQIISNANRKGITFKSSTLYWHSDQSFCARPSPVTLLRAVQVPSTGGRTLFADLRGAFEDLPAEMRDRCRRLRACHSFSFLMAPLMEQRQGVGASLPLLPLYPDVLHPLVLRHSRTGRESLFLSELCVRQIATLGHSESTQLLSELNAHALQARYIYAHQWRLGDVVVWYNPGLVHRADDIPVEEPRLFYRSNTESEDVYSPCC